MIKNTNKQKFEIYVKYFKKEYELIASSNAFLFETNIISGKENLENESNELNNNLDETDEEVLLETPPDKIATTKDILAKIRLRTIAESIYGAEENAFWPFAKIDDLPLYASVGFSENRIHQYFDDLYHPPGYFYELDKNNIHYIVTLGNAGEEKESDFPKYFINKKTYTHIYGTKKWEIEVDPTPIQSDTKFYTIHQLNCTYKFTDLSTGEISTKKRIINLYNIPMRDGTPILFTPESMAFYDTLLDVLKSGNGVAVHCKVGMGRTGQLIAELVFLLQNLIEEIFKDNDSAKIAERLRTFIEKLRRNRTGLMLEASQIYLFLVNVVTYVKIKYQLNNELNKTNGLNNTSTTDPNNNLDNNNNNDNHVNNNNHDSKRNSEKRKLEKEEIDDNNNNNNSATSHNGTSQKKLYVNSSVFYPQPVPNNSDSTIQKQESNITNTNK